MTIVRDFNKNEKEKDDWIDHGQTDIHAYLCSKRLFATKGAIEQRGEKMV